MKMLEGLNRRDRSLLVLVVVLITLYICYSFVMEPSLEATNIIKQERAMIDSDMDRAKSLMAKKEELAVKAEIERNELIDRYSTFFFDPKQSQLLYALDNLIIDSGIRVSSYTPSPDIIGTVPIERGAFSPAEYHLKDLAKEISPDFYKKYSRGSQEGSSGGEISGSDIIPGRDITFRFEDSSYESVFGFITAVENMKKTTILKSIRMEGSGAGIGGEMVITFFSLPALDEGQDRWMKINPVIPRGKVNPFS
ncbi:MAG: hypothetical protein ACOX4U_03855 [Anaerovoracaceae bacterium]|jgi:hypothetical protein